MLDPHTKEFIKTATLAVIDALDTLPKESADPDKRVTRELLSRVKADLILIGRVRGTK